MKNLNKLFISYIFLISLNASAFNSECLDGANYIQEAGQSGQYPDPIMWLFEGRNELLDSLYAGGVALEQCFYDFDEMMINSSGIIENTNNININELNINANSALIATNTTNINTNSALIATNTTNIATNVASIAANSSLILANQQNISANTLNIETLFTNIDSLTSSVNSINEAIINQSTMLSKGIASSIAISNVGYSSDGWEFGFGRGDFNNEHEHAFGLSYGSDNASFKVAYTRESTSFGFKVKLGN